MDRWRRQGDDGIAEERRRSRGEGFITQDLLLLPGGGEALERATALHTWGAFIRCAEHGSLVRFSIYRRDMYTWSRVARMLASTLDDPTFPSDCGLPSCPVPAPHALRSA